LGFLALTGFTGLAVGGLILALGSLFGTGFGATFATGLAGLVGAFTGVTLAGTVLAGATGAALRGLAAFVGMGFTGAVDIMKSFTKCAFQFRLADQPLSIATQV
jgi:hypothetical protein